MGLEDIGVLLKAGLPWPVTAAVVALVLWWTKGVQAHLLIRKQNMEERQYGDTQNKEREEALVQELRDQIKDLKTSHAAVLVELREVRTNHAKCEIQHAELKGKLEVLEVKLNRLESHDKANKEQLDVLKEGLGNT